MAEYTEEQREARRAARRASRRAARIRRAHERASRFTSTSLLTEERDVLAARNFVFHGVIPDEEGFAFVALAGDAAGHRLEALGMTPEQAVNNLVRNARD